MVASSPRARYYARENNIDLSEVTGSGPNKRIIEQDVIIYNKEFVSGSHNLENRSRISPLAKNIARTENIDLKQISGSGANGKIMSRDIYSFMNEKKQDKKGQKTKSLTGMRKIVAERMVESKKTAPHVTLTVKVEATDLVGYKTSISESSEINITYTDLLVKIVSEAVNKYPGINVSLIDGKLIYHDDINVGLAVALKSGLIVPNIKEVNKKSLINISKEVKRMVAKAKEEKLNSEDMQNGSLTISNLGMYQVDGFTPIINQPESAILGVGRIVEDVIIENKQIRIGKVMTLSLAFDHRVIDGAPAAEFLGEIKRLVENPEQIPRGAEE